jgi:hypothetical protein
MRIGPLLARLRELEQGYAEELRAAAERHRDDHDVFHQCLTFAKKADERAQKLAPLATRYGGDALWSVVVQGTSADLLEDLRLLFLRAEECSITWVMAGQAAQAARDRELLDVVRTCHQETEIQVKWFVTRIKVASPQALVVG